MPVLSIQTWGLPQQGLTEEEQIQLHKELENCTEVVGTIRNSVESYMKEKAIRHIEELDYTHRQEYESWLSPELTHGTKVKYLTGFDWIKRMQSEKKQIRYWEETRRYYMKIKYGFFYIIQIRKWLPDLTKLRIKKHWYGISNKRVQNG